MNNAAVLANLDVAIEGLKAAIACLKADAAAAYASFDDGTDAKGNAKGNYREDFHNNLAHQLRMLEPTRAHLASGFGHGR